MTPIQDKPSRNEDEYFAKNDAEYIKQQRVALDEQRRKAERAAHLGKCPRCGADLQEREYHHVKIDMCPECEGMWMDKGELQMIERVDRNRVARFIENLLRIDKE